MGQVRTVADPLGRRQGEQVGHLVEGHGVLRAQLGELLPAHVTAPHPIARLDQPLDGNVIFGAFDDGVLLAFEPEDPVEVFDQVIADCEHQPGRSLRPILHCAHDEDGGVHDRAE